MLIALDARFDDLDVFANTVRDWDLDFRLMEPNGFSGRVRQLVSADVLLAHARFERRLDQAGATPPGFKTFVIPGARCHGFWWRGYQASTDSLLAFPRGSELRSASFSDFEVYTVSVRNELLEQLTESMGVADSAAIDDRLEVMRLEPATIHALRRLAGTIASSDGGAPAAEQARCLAERLVALGKTEHKVDLADRRQRDRALARVLDYIRSEPIPSVELAVLCRIGQVSERTLQYAFKERYGISPGDFIKRWKLNSVRRMLRDADDGSLTIGDVAARCGFWHLSQFAVDYRRLFAERPMETLRRARRAFRH